MKYYIISIVVLGAVLAWVLFDDEMPDEWQQFIDKTESNYQGENFLRDLTGKIGGRLSGTPSGNAAEDFLIEKLKNAGFEKVQVDTFSFQGWQREFCELKVIGQSGSIPATALGFTPQSITTVAELINLSYGSESDFANLSDQQISGKIGLIDLSGRPGVLNEHRTVQIYRAIEHHLAGVIFMNRYQGGQLGTGTSSFGKEISIPAISISREEGLALREQIKSNPVLKVAIRLKNKLNKTFARNIYVDLPGSDPSLPGVLIGSHLDSWDLGQGAVDNGLGVSVLFEAARQLKNQQVPLKRNIRFVWFGAEELGLIGSYAWLDKHRLEMEKVLYMINLDMPSRFSAFNLMLDNSDEDFFVDLAKKLKSLGLQDHISMIPLANSDHVPFMLDGLKIISFTNNLSPDYTKIYHSDQDSINRVDFDDLKNTTYITALTLYAIGTDTDLQLSHLSPQSVQRKLQQSNLDKILRMQSLLPSK